jgi:transcriptional regulator with XRE-family HTH domain
MSKRKSMDKAQARERRNRLLESAAAAELSLTEGVREMRAISGLTQEEFARHRGVSARVVKALELGQGNPTVATLNRIGQFFGLEVAFVPIQQKAAAEEQPPAALTPEVSKRIFPADTANKTADVQNSLKFEELRVSSPAEIIQSIELAREDIWRRISKAIEALEVAYPPSQRPTGDKPQPKKRKPRSP